MLSLLLCILFAGVVCWAVSSPYFDDEEIPNRQRADSHEKERYLQMLKDLELDFALNKVSERDYRSMRALLMRDLSRVMKAETTVDVG